MLPSPSLIGLGSVTLAGAGGGTNSVSESASEASDTCVSMYCALTVQYVERVFSVSLKLRDC